MSLKQKTLSGLKWSVIDNVSGLGIQFVVGLILARLLSPVEFGLIGMVTVFISVSLLFIDSGFSNSLIRKVNCTGNDLSTVFYFNLAVSVILYGILYHLAGPVSLFYKEPCLVNIIRILGLSFIVLSLGMIQRTILVKKVDFRKQTVISVISSLFSGGLAVTMAYLGYGVWSLVAKTVVANLILTTLLWFWSEWKPSFMFDVKAFREHLSFGYKLLFANLINLVYQNSYYVLIGKFFSAADLGFYTKAEEYSNLPATNLSNVIQRVSYPVLAEMQDDAIRLKKSYKKLVRNTMFISFVSMMGLAAVASPLILILIGEKWAQSIDYIQLLCFSAMFYPLSALNLNILNIKGRTDLSLRIEVIKKVLVVPVFILAVFYGIKAMLTGLIIFSLVAFILNSYYSGMLVAYSMREQVADILPSFLLGFVICGSLYTEYFLLKVNSPILLLIQVFTGAAILVFVSEAFKYGPYLEMKGIVASKLWRMLKQ